MDINNQQKLINIFSDISEGFITNYHNDLFWLIRKEHQSICDEINEEQDHEKLKDLSCVRDRYEHHAQILSNSVFQMYYSYAEEWIFLKIQKTKFKVLISHRGSITRFKEPLVKLGIDISKKDWSIISEAENIRDCLSHANGRYDLACLKNKKLKRIVEAKKNSSFFQIKNKRLYVTRKYLNYFKKAIRNILHHPENTYCYKKNRNALNKFIRCYQLFLIKIKRKIF